ncbi:sensor histidine kinase [Candidatus Magnetomonas plexicatena]|uniref:sensor histidine kinase n=1 Tax=Candidatus Magnetomonas plexicatena TaxID=2552947 RepID=UPI001C75B169|nr:hypothetical protein E2O03_002445 [Nitrospirales bacterium LBB_01]
MMTSKNKQTKGFLSRVSLTVKIAAITIVIGITLSTVLDHFHRKALKETFNAQLLERLETQAKEDRKLFDTHFFGYHRAVKALVNHYFLINYVEKVSWSDNTPVKVYQKEIPPWLPQVSVLKYYPEIEYALLVDSHRKIREVYTEYSDPVPPSLTSISDYVIETAIAHSFIARLDGVNYVIASGIIKNENNKETDSLVIVHRINSDFLKDAMGTDKGIVALYSDDENAVISTNAPDMISIGKSLDDLKTEYMFTGKSFLDYGEIENKYSFISLISKSTFAGLSVNILTRSLKYNVTTAFALIVSFVIIVLYMMRKVRMLDDYIADVSKRQLGIDCPTLIKSKNRFIRSDQIIALEYRFHSLFDKIVEAKRQLEKKAVDLEQVNNELKEATAQLVQTAKLSALGELTAGVAHELNQPLNGIKIICQSVMKDIQKDRHNPEELVTDLADIVEQVDKMAAIIDHMRIFTRRSDTMVVESVNINALIEASFKLLGQQLKSNNIMIKTNFSPELLQIKGDHIRLEQVIINLTSNARNALKASGKAEMRLEIKTYCSDNFKLPSGTNSIVIEVQDNGHGIPQAIKDKIFQPFFTTNEPGKGTGLGLSVSRKIIEEHGGLLLVESEEGIGTTFKIVLPTPEQQA